MSEPNSVQQILQGAGTCPGQTEHESHATERRCSAATVSQLDALGRWSRPVDQDLLGCLLGAGDRWFAFDEGAAFESCAGADERDEVWCVDRAPALLCGLDQLERHRDPGGP